MEGFAGWIIVLVVALVAFAYAVNGIVWLVVHEWPWLVLGGSILLAGAIFAFACNLAPDRVSRIDAQVLRAKADEAAREVVRARQGLERETVELQEIQARRKTDFHYLTNRHFTSFRTADAWYRHKNDAVGTRGELSRSLNLLRTRKNQLSRPKRQALQVVIDGLNPALSRLSEEIRRGAEALTRHNSATAGLRDYIIANCGERGRRWGEDLARRKALRR